MKNCQKLYKLIFLVFVSCFLLCVFLCLPASSVQAKTQKTVTKQTSITQLNTIIAENNENLEELFKTQKQLNTDCSEAIKNALDNSLLVNEKDYKSLQKLSSDLEKKTAKLKKAKVQQEELQKTIDSMTDTKSSSYRKNKCEIITLQKRQLKLIAQINQVTKKIIKLCTPAA